MTQVQDDQIKEKRGRQARNRGASQAANQHIGDRIRMRRALMDISQAKLGKVLGLSPQQMQKYECGTSSVGAGQLCEVAKALDVPISFFYDGLNGESFLPASDIGSREDRLTRDELEMLGHYRAVPSYIRDSIRSLIGYVSKHGPDVAAAPVKQESPDLVSPPAGDAGPTPAQGMTTSDDDAAGGAAGDAAGGISGPTDETAVPEKAGRSRKAPRRPYGATWTPSDIRK
jgi:transcriptional regulator with XRE-family HTH domain